jgi:3-deoxy-7-phosphoheptulonate synthase
MSAPYKLASREHKKEDTVIALPNGVKIGGREIAVIGGPCAVESEEQLMRTAELVSRAGGVMLRGGAFKPRSSPYSFQGLAGEGLILLAKAGAAYNLSVITEAIDAPSADLVARHADVIQIGARNMQNFALLKHVGRLKKPVLLKRGLSATITELLLAAEYIMSEGNEQVMLCERGIRSFDDSTRNLLDLSAIPVLKARTHLPILADPSHGTGFRELVVPMARAAVAAGADALMVEVHPEPESALSDGTQSLHPAQFVEMMNALTRVAHAVDRSILAR